MTTERRVLFASAFRCETSLNISHATFDGIRTLCGRKVEDAATNEDASDIPPDCLICSRAWERAKVQP